MAFLGFALFPHYESASRQNGSRKAKYFPCVVSGGDFLQSQIQKIYTSSRKRAA